MRVCVLKNQSKSQQIKLNMVNNTNPTQGNIQLVVDPRVGVILGSVNQQQGSNLCKKHDSFIINLKSFVIGNTTTTAASPTSGVSTQSQTENVRRFELSICLSLSMEIEFNGIKIFLYNLSSINILDQDVERKYYKYSNNLIS